LALEHRLAVDQAAEIAASPFGIDRDAERLPALPPLTP